MVDGKKYLIPVDDKGCVPEYALAMRFNRKTDGGRNGTYRSPSRDLDKTASKSLKLGAKIKPEDIAEWWAHPNESDIIGIDNETTQIYDTDGATRKSSLQYQKKIGIVGTPEERRQVRKTLDDTFTTAELKKITENGSTYLFAYNGRMNLESNMGGYYNPDNGLIVIKKGASSGTIVHETTHKLRHNDTKRTGTFTSSKIVEHSIKARSGDMVGAEYIRAVEEAGTECETVARLSPYKMNGRRVSYYGKLTGDEDKAKKMISEDRKMLVGNSDPDKKGLRGRKAVSSVEKNFKKTNISRYGYGGALAREYKKS